MIKVNLERARYIAEVLRPYRNIIKELFLRDPQYTAIEQLAKARSCGEAALLVILNSLVSYKLRTVGEKYWLEFSKYYSSKQRRINAVSFKEFLVRSNNTLQLDQKMKRVERILASALSREILQNPLKYCGNLSLLVEELARVLKSSRSSKTIVFTAKMYGYLCYICGVEANFHGIEMPIDFRNALLAITSCIIQGCGGKLVECAWSLTTSSNAELARKAWQTVCNSLEIPCLYLDTFTWLITGILLKESFNLEKAVSRINSVLGVELRASVLKALVECVNVYV